MDDLEETYQAKAEEIHLAPYLLSFIASYQQGTLGMLSASAFRPAVALLQYYVEEGIPVSTVPPWLKEVLDNAIKNGPHASVYTPETEGFIWG